LATAFSGIIVLQITPCTANLHRGALTTPVRVKLYLVICVQSWPLTLQAFHYRMLFITELSASFSRSSLHPVGRWNWRYAQYQNFIFHLAGSWAEFTHWPSCWFSQSLAVLMVARLQPNVRPCGSSSSPNIFCSKVLACLYSIKFTHDTNFLVVVQPR
jgi:hypothetical protein